ncbi:MAG: AraC family transcriptional regulator [Saprospirales bacterium]|nr:MAG: AraC family transcriptional regulator [Saprospirales bacterium]
MPYNHTLFTALLSFFLFLNEGIAVNGTDPISIPFSAIKKSLPLGDSLIQVWEYEFQDTRLHNLRPHIYLEENGLFYLFSSIGFFTFDKRTLYELPQKSLFPATNIDYSLLDNNGWLWLMNNNFNPYRPIYNIQFLNLKTYQQKVQRDFFEDSNLKNVHLTAIFQLSSGEIVFSTSDKYIYLYHDGEAKALFASEHLVLLGIGPGDKLILMDTNLDQILLKGIGKDGDSQYLPKFNFRNTILECYLKNGQLVCLSGINHPQKFYTLTLESSELSWISRAFPPKSLFIFNQLKPYLISIAEPKKFYFLTKDGAVKNTFSEIISKNFSLTDQSSIFFSDQRLIFPTNNGLIIAKLVKNKICNALNNERPKQLSSRGLKFQSKNELWVSSYSGFHSLNFNLQDCTIEQTKTSYSCTPSYIHQTLISPDGDKKIKFSNNITTINLSDGSCRSLEVKLFGIDEIWDMLPLTNEWYLLGTSTGLYLTNLSHNPPIKVKFQADPVDEVLFDGFERIEFFRLKYSLDSNSIFAASSKGLFALNLPNSLTEESSNWSVLERVQAELVVRDVFELNDGSLLLASQNNGIVWVSNDNDRRILAEYNTNNALRNNFSHNILQDELDRIWVSTNFGLYLIDLERNIWRALSQFNGFSDNEFNYLAAAQSKEGLMAFGGLNGVSIFDPKKFDIECKKNTFYLKSIQALKKPEKILGKQNYSENSHKAFFASLYPKNQELQFHFSGPNLERFYSFFIRKSGTREWSRLSNNKTLLVDVIHPGVNQYELAGILGNGKVVLSEQEITIDLKEKKSSLIWILSSLVSLAFITYFYKRRKRRATKPKNGVQENIQKYEHSENLVKENTNYFQPLKSPKSVYFKNYQNLQEVKELNNLIFDLNEKEILPKGIAEDDMDFIISLKTFILDSLNEESISTEELARKMTVSYRQLHRLITEKTGLTPNKFIALVKVIAGRRILTLDRNKNVKDTSYYLGYSKPSHFSTLFKEVYGISPKKYQMKLKTLIEKIEAITQGNNSE